MPPANEKTLPPFEYRTTIFGELNSTFAAVEKYRSGDEPCVGRLRKRLAPCLTERAPEHFKSGTPLLAVAVA